MLLAAKNITKNFASNPGFFADKALSVAALKGVSFEVSKGETLGIVGESGCGKTTLGRILCGIIQPSSGHRILGSEIAHPHRDIQIVGQNPFESMDPLWTIGDSIKEPLVIHHAAAHWEGRLEMALERVNLQPDILAKKPHECSGGQRQRAVLARAVILEPKILICDEPTSHLDLSIQAQILNLLMELKNATGMTLVFISHDMEVVKRICDRILFMSSGIIVEEKSTSQP